MTFIPRTSQRACLEQLHGDVTPAPTSYDAVRLERSIAALEKAGAAYRAGWGLWCDVTPGDIAAIDVALLERFAPELGRWARFLASEAATQAARPAA